jgi:hypothetical protein
MTSFSFEYSAINGVTDDTREKHDEGIHDTLDQGKGDHVTISNMTDLMSHHSSCFITTEIDSVSQYSQRQERYCDPIQSRMHYLFGFENTNFGHSNSCIFGQFCNRFN